MELKKKLNCIMLVDDDDPTNFLHQLEIDKAQCTEHVRVFESSESALEYLVRSLAGGEQDDYYQKPDLILLDINMPRTNGWEFLEAYRTHPEVNKSGVVIMMLTTSLNPDDANRAEKINEIAGFYNKPLTVEILHKIIAENFPENL